MSDVDKDLVCRLYDQQWGLSRIARHVRTHEAQVRRILAESGRTLRKPGRPRVSIDGEKAVELYSRGTLREAAAELGCSDSCLWGWMRSHGHATRSRGEAVRRRLSKQEPEVAE